MKTSRLFFVTFLMLVVIGTLVGCTNANQKSPDVADNIRKALDQAGLKDVSVSQDRDKGVVTLSGNVSSDDAKAQAESLAKSIAAPQVVANQIAMVPNDGAREAKAVNADLDKGIEQNLDAALIQNKMKNNVKYNVKNGVVTLTGDVNSQGKRDQATKIASGVPNVQQVVNDLQIKNQKASSTK
jgi:hyperosmotically inducible protein